MPRKSDKGGTYSVYLTNAVAHLMDQAAAKEHRSFSNMLDLALRDWLGSHGYDVAKAEKDSGQRDEGDRGPSSATSAPVESTE